MQQRNIGLEHLILKLEKVELLDEIKNMISKIKLYTIKDIDYYSYDNEDMIEKQAILEEFVMMLYLDISDLSINYYMKSIYNINAPRSFSKFKAIFKKEND